MNYCISQNPSRQTDRQTDRQISDTVRIQYRGAISMSGYGSFSFYSKHIHASIRKGLKEIVHYER